MKISLFVLVASTSSMAIHRMVITLNPAMETCRGFI
jgi:hypothetical protein